MNDVICHYGVLGMKWGIRRTPEQLGHKKPKKPKKIPNATYLPNYKGAMYFISQEDLSKKTLKPRVPNNYFTENGFEDSDTKRVSFAGGVNECLMGMSYNCAGKTFNVYEPKDRTSLNIYKPNTKAVPDSKITGELWVTDPVELKLVGTVFCTGDSGKDGHPFDYGDGKVAELYDWDWQWIEK